ncbi:MULTISPECIES: hypothetical protein [unclassified Kaistella]|uniref:hypothetical protein n=1 Tax=unclassified Kaistella TaxID=2762626 RepID=UPI0027362957|nr:MULTISPECIES: hypothetical protein [unclassified Kaistella]MCZ2083809.1 hypothetical protein [Flavobacteriales bacterium]MDP2452759.1 hypothetical protein [Kaistella sp. SH11-4b]MDP2455668.1 hypothetical protein [Kaistella sp. SH40-3]MDP2458572.1 hypothetical protein [Kaistella sp. SH19-2b]
MKTNTATIQGILSIGALVCILIGFFNLLSPEINEFLYQKLFYILIGASFFVQAPTLSNKNFLYPMYAAAALCVIGAFIPVDSQFSAVKTIGLFAGVLMSIFSRPRMPRAQ